MFINSNSQHRVNKKNWCVYSGQIRKTWKDEQVLRKVEFYTIIYEWKSYDQSDK